MKKSKYRPRTLLMFAVCTFFILGLGHYLWNFDYHLDALTATGSNDKKMVVPSLRVEVNPKPKSVNAFFTLWNATGNARARVLDTERVLLLYEINLEIQDDSGRFIQVSPSQAYWSQLRKIESERGKGAYNPGTDIQVELPSGGSYTRPPIPVSNLFQIVRDGKYRLTIAYKPDKVMTFSELDQYGLFSEQRILSAGFEIQSADARPIGAAPAETPHSQTPNAAPK